MMDIFEMELNQPEGVSEQAELLEILMRQGEFRLTNQRQKILSILKDTNQQNHFSAEDIYQALLEQGEKIGLSTIYRALHLWVGLGILRELPLSEERKYYELSAPFVEEHHHLVCVQCGAIQEFEEPLIREAAQQEARDRGFVFLNCEFILYVQCPRCGARLT
jgi:Fur family ferric uptake transcriptional regulator